MNGPDMTKAQVNAADELLGPTLRRGGANDVAVLLATPKSPMASLMLRRTGLGTL